MNTRYRITITFRASGWMENEKQWVIGAKTTKELEDLLPSLYDDTVKSITVIDNASKCEVKHDKGIIYPQFRNR